jgi:hypothetical protein
MQKVAIAAKHMVDFQLMGYSNVRENPYTLKYRPGGASAK